MRIVLVHPPLAVTQSRESLHQLDDHDNSRPAIGLYSLAATLLEAGHEVRLAEDALTPWRESLQGAKDFKPDLVGLTAMTHNREIARQWSRDFKELCPKTPLILGGVHATHLFADILERWPQVDFVAVGEAEESLPELVRRLERQEETTAIPGIASRLPGQKCEPNAATGQMILEGVPSGEALAERGISWAGFAPPILDLGRLPVPIRHFSYDILSASRGCPFQCAFCCSPAMWGRKVRHRPVEHVLEELEGMARYGYTQVGFKDETFTMNARRVEEVCRAILDRGIRLWWSCDTRVDCVDEERLYWMRKAGCDYVSFGVESGSPEMLERINKRTRPEQVREATRLARRFGIKVRFYLIRNLPGEKPKDIEASLNLTRQSRPHFVYIADLVLSPGTELFRQYCRDFEADDSIWFTHKAPLLEWPKRAVPLNHPRNQELAALSNVIKEAESHEPLYPFTEEELRDALKVAPECYATNLDLALFLKKTERYSEALPFFEAALEQHPQSDKAMTDLGACLMQTGQTDKARQLWADVTQMELARPVNRAMAHLHLAALTLKEKDVDAALSHCWQAHELQPDDPDPLCYITETAFRVQRLEEAEKAAELWTKRAPESGAPWHYLAVMAVAQKNLADGQTFFEAAIQREPQHPEYRTNYARLLAQAGHLDPARKLLEPLKERYTPAAELLKQLEGLS